MKSTGVTIADVAREAGVSPMTVSRSLREPERVSAKSREQIAAVIERLGYVPDPAARALAAGRTNVIGVIIPSVTNNVFADVMRGIYGVIEDSQWQVQLGNSRYVAETEEALTRTFLSQRPAGLIVSGIDQTNKTRELLKNAPCRIVQIMEIGASPIDMMVGFSHSDGARAATRHLIDRGYKRPGFLAARIDPRTQRRMEGFEDVTRAAGIFDPNRILTTPAPSSAALGRDLMARLLEHTPDTDAVLCNNDDLALGAVFECLHRGIDVPNNMGICGFNDLEMMAAAYPAITSVKTYREEMGRMAATMLLQTLQGDEPEMPVVDLGYSVMVRESTARKPKS
ncbi:LacI family DNA-binding transcriptional regulator [Ahrensia sp. 13_GOM-1096m]|uniref:LacI family DNA-binding transcriptional regulator n=1 Tax=Ahrensia sp. 13_GOM-1096m TaxID=1380380 RepID=UPI00047893B3|nr:LacI family DNA-binding transcriptional regulator [Ahrensia sp. 13_GOM-1096m]